MSIDGKKKSAVAIGNRVRAQRERLGISQEELAAKVGYKGKGSISRIESGENEVKQSKLPLLADALETDVAYLMGWTAPNPTLEANNALSEDEKELLSYYRQMNNQEAVPSTDYVRTCLNGCDDFLIDKQPIMEAYSRSKKAAS